jgi:iron complex outermembrane receptor protein
MRDYNSALRAAIIGSASIGCIAIATPASAQERSQRFDIPAQAAANGLNEWAKQADRQIVFPYAAVNGRRTPAVRGKLTPRQALDRLISPLGLSITSNQNGTVTLAYPAQQPAADVAADDPPTEPESSEIVVTASRIDRAFEAPTPVVSVTAQALKMGGPSNIAEALNDLPQFRGTRGPQVTTTNIDGGSSPIDLRGLGIARTLVLLDGRRFSADNDLNTVPTVLIKRVDIVTGGASAAWGSGAVAGVVNIAIDDGFNGLKLGAEATIASRGDYDGYRFEGAFGKSFADGRGHILFGGEYYDSQGIQPRTERRNAGRWSSVSNGAGAFFLSPDIGFANAAMGGLILSGPLRNKAFNPDGTLRDFQLGTVIGTSMVGGEGPSNDQIAPLVAPIRRYNMLGRISYEFSDALKVTAELRHSRFYNSYNAFADNSRGTITIKTDNAYLPAAVRTQLAAAGQTSFTFGRFNGDFATEVFEIDRPTTQGTIALDGRFGESWRWSAYYSHGEARNDTSTPGVIITQNFNQAIDSLISPTTGQPICRVALANPTTNCVPINLFGNGNVSAAAAAYVTGAPTLRARSKLDVGGISLRGEPFSLPAGPVSIAVGTEARREAVVQVADALSLARAFGSFNTAPLAGKFTVKEAFGEILVPLLKDVTLLNDLQFNGAVRVSDYSTTGSIWSWKLGVTNEFFPGFRGRFTKSRDIRSANLAELFTTRTQGQTTVSDPVTGQSSLVSVIGGGNVNLVPETADTMTGGFVFSPPSLPGFSASIDYYKIKIDDVIVTLVAQDIVARCFNGNQDLCARVSRDGAGNILQVLSSNVNLSRYKTDGIDVDLSYGFSLGDGRMTVRGLASWVNSLTTDDGISRIQYRKSQNAAFGLGVPALRATGSISYDGPRFGGYLRGRYISAGNTDNTVKNVNGQIPAYAYVDLGATAKVEMPGGTKAELYIDVSNLFDKDPPKASNFSPYYDVIGTYFSAGARIRF